MRTLRVDEGFVDVRAGAPAIRPRRAVIGGIAHEALLNAARHRTKHVAARARVGFNQGTVWRANATLPDAWRSERNGDEGEYLCNGARRE